MLYQDPAVFLCFLTNKSFWFNYCCSVQQQTLRKHGRAVHSRKFFRHYLLEDKTSRYVISGNPWVTTLFHEGGIAGICFHHRPQCSCSESDREEIALKKIELDELSGSKI